MYKFAAINLFYFTSNNYLNFLKVLLHLRSNRIANIVTDSKGPYVSTVKPIIHDYW